MVPPEKKEVNAGTYVPLSFEEAKVVEDLPMPAREFRENETEKSMAIINCAGTIIINMVHKDYPDAFCQIQCSKDPKGFWKVFFEHVSPTDHYIPDEVAEEFIRKWFFKAKEQFKKGSPI